MKLSVIIPVYNEEQTIGEIIDRVCCVELAGLEKEIVVSDDGSTDKTSRIVDEAAISYGGLVRTYHSPINLGKGAAVRVGLELASGDIILIQDADLELVPEEYHLLLAPILEGRSEVVYGSRFLHPINRIPLVTRWANRVLTTLTNWLFGGHLTDMETAYKAFKREVIQGIRLRCVGFDFEPEVTAKLLMAGHKIGEVPISYNPRRDDQGKKIRWSDGIAAVVVLLRCRFSHGSW